MVRIRAFANADYLEFCLTRLFRNEEISGTIADRKAGSILAERAKQRMAGSKTLVGGGGPA